MVEDISVDRRSVRLALWILADFLDADCRALVGDWLPLSVYCRCAGCGFCLLACDSHGRTTASSHARYSFEYCTLCYNLCLA